MLTSYFVKCRKILLLLTAPHAQCAFGLKMVMVNSREHLLTFFY